MRKCIPLIAAALALGAVSAAAAAGEIVVTQTPAPSVTVSLADLDLATPTGLATGKSRINAAAADLCLTNAVEPVNLRMARAKCYRSAVADGRWQLDHMIHMDEASTAATGFILTKTAR